MLTVLAQRALSELGVRRMAEASPKVTFGGDADFAVGAEHGLGAALTESWD